MNTESITIFNKEKTLFSLDCFCSKNEINYAVTGTMALNLLGLPIKWTPSDIDIVVFYLTLEQKTALKQLQDLSGLKNENYEDGECYSFVINGVKINAIVNKDWSYTKYMDLTLSMLDNINNEEHLINVQNVEQALTAKMKLHRDKDKSYMLDLIANLARL